MTWEEVLSQLTICQLCLWGAQDFCVSDLVGFDQSTGPMAIGGACALRQLIAFLNHLTCCSSSKRACVACRTSW